MDNSINSAEAYYRAVANQAEKDFRQTQERNFDKEALLTIIDELKNQNNLLQTQIEDDKKQLEKTEKTNKKLLFWAIFSAIIAVGSLIAMVLIAIFNR